LQELPAARADRLRYFQKAFPTNLFAQALAVRAKRPPKTFPALQGAILRPLLRKMLLALPRRQSLGTERAPGIPDAHRVLSGNNRIAERDHLSGWRRCHLRGEPPGNTNPIQ
jgi:hypothetical protein